MTAKHTIEGIAAPLNIANLDTDQIMPKQFLRGIDKKGLDKGVLWDLRFNAKNELRKEFVLNRPEYAETKILLAGPNFGCGSSREHAVWGLKQFGIQAEIAAGFGEIFYSNAMNNGLVAVILPADIVADLLQHAEQADKPLQLAINVETLQVITAKESIPFTMSDRHRNMFLEGVDMVGASLACETDIAAFARQHWEQQPWLKDVASRTKARLDQNQ